MGLDGTETSVYALSTLKIKSVISETWNCHFIHFCHVHRNKISCVRVCGVRVCGMCVHGVCACMCMCVRACRYVCVWLLEAHLGSCTFQASSHH